MSERGSKICMEVTRLPPNPLPRVTATESGQVQFIADSDVLDPAYAREFAIALIHKANEVEAATTSEVEGHAWKKLGDEWVSWCKRCGCLRQTPFTFAPDDGVRWYLVPGVMGKSTTEPECAREVRP